MVFCDYFSASDDAAAVRVLDEPGGPDTAAFDVVALKGIDPVVAMARLEAILTGCAYEEAAKRPRSGELLSSPEAEDAFVVSVSDTLREALAAASPEALAEAAGSWAETDELRKDGVTSGTAAEVLVSLSALAGRASAESQRLYCWLAL
jgi:hypothetical protein